MTDGFGRPATVLVLGGASDIGLATARQLVAAGARTVVLGARRPEALAPAIESLAASGTDVVVALPFDALDVGSHAAFVDDVFDRHGDVDVALLAFGVLPDEDAAMKDASVALEAARINYLGAMSVLIPLASRMHGQGHGTIVVLSSVAAERGRRSNFVYGSSKAGLDTFCQGLADRLHGSGVRLLLVRPGFVRSKMTLGREPMPLSTTPEAVGRAIVDCLTSGAPIIWVPPALRWVMSGLRHLPRPLFRRLEV
jgi:decaprenylphospho-beta-D-erythro-pentofuranosid-2-ulose 2-reductase